MYPRVYLICVSQLKLRLDGINAFVVMRAVEEACLSPVCLWVVHPNRLSRDVSPRFRE